MERIKFLDLQKVNNKYADEIHTAAIKVIDSGWYLNGQSVSRFESDYSNYIGTKCCVSCASGLDALILMLKGCIETGRLSVGDEVIVPANTFIATILAITECGLKPVFVEPSIDTLQIDDTKIENSITSRTKAIILVHLYGKCAMTDKISQLCSKYNLLLFEDNAQSHGCIYKGKKTGSLGYAAAHSFYPGKVLGALGDGGAVTTDDNDLASVIRSLANYGSQKKYVFKYQGRNSRLDEMQAAILNVKLHHLDEDIMLRRQIARYYIDNINNSDILIPEIGDMNSHVFHLFPILTSRRDALQHYLSDKGIETAIHYPIPPHKQECYCEWNALSLPVTEQIHLQELSLPISPVMTIDEAAIVVNAVNNFK